MRTVGANALVQQTTFTSRSQVVTKSSSTSVHGHRLAASRATLMRGETTKREGSLESLPLAPTIESQALKARWTRSTL